MKLFPKRKPYKRGYFPVGEDHELFYELYGNPTGIPILFVHGGPGSGCSDKAYRHFNPKKFNIMCVDQRSSGKSKPYASLKANTTQRLVRDFRKFLKFMKIEKTYLFGGSWGSTLSLCYAIKYPVTVKGMVLRGIFLASKEENDYFLKGGCKTHFPEVWETLISKVPNKYKKNPVEYFMKMLNHKDPKVVYKFARDWSLYEFSILSLEYDMKKARKEVKGKWIVPFARIEAHYLMQKCFLPKDYILKNVDKMKNIPLSIIHGRYDFVCIPDAAYKLHKALPKSKLFFVTAGHSSSDPENRSTMIREIHAMVKKYK